MSDSLFSPLLSGHLRGGQWRFPTEEMWRIPFVTCWGASAPPAPTWAPPNSKSWAGEPPSSVSRNSQAKCSLSRVYTGYALCYVDFKRAIGGQQCNTYRRKTHTNTSTLFLNLFVSGYAVRNLSCRSLSFALSLPWNIFPQESQRFNQLNSAASVFCTFGTTLIC